MNKIWLETAQSLGTLNGENISRKTYVKIPEFEETEKAWIGAEQEWAKFFETLSDIQREQAAHIKECMENYASAQEKRSYIQGYVDCVQLLFHMSLLKKYKFNTKLICSSVIAFCFCPVL